MKQVRSFDDIIGGQKLAAYIRESDAKGHIPHALMLVGEEGSGKKTFARLFAKTIQCEVRRGDPCLNCQSCLQIDAGQHPDVKMIAPEEGKKRRSISVKAIRAELSEGAYIKPYKGPYKIYVVDQAQNMTIEAQNALLKILEEPPAYIVIVLLTTNEDSLLQTVRSRCVIFRTESASQEETARYLMEEIMVPDYLAYPAAQFARGNLGKAARLALSEKFRDIYAGVVRYFERARHLEYDQILEVEEQYAKDAETLDLLLDMIHLYLRDLLAVKTGTAEGKLFFANEEEALYKAAGSVSYKGIAEIEKQIFAVRERLEENVAPDMALEVLLTTIKEKML